MCSTELCICNEIFNFSGQNKIDTWALRDVLISGTARYSRWLVDDIHLTMQRILDLADRFPFWQRERELVCMHVYDLEG